MSDLSVTREIDADVNQLWAMVADVTRMHEWSPENEAAVWLHNATGPQPGARFRGTNRNGDKSWKTVATIIDSAPGRVFAFSVKAMGLDIAEWRYTFEPTPTGCRVTETWTDRRNRLLKTLSRRVTGVIDRAAHNRSGMNETLERLAKAAESGATANT